MDNKIIIELIKKDLEELKLLVEAIESKPGDSEILINICRSKANSLVQEIELLSPGHLSIPDVAKAQKEETLPAEDSVERIPNDYRDTTLADADIQLEVQNSEIEHKAGEHTISEAELKGNSAEEQSVEETQDDTNTETASADSSSEKHFDEELEHRPLAEKKDLVVDDKSTQKKPVEVAPANEKNVEPKPDINGDMKQARVLGEKFTSEPSLNERFANLAQKQSKFSPKPIPNLKKAIGINDRFLYTRELFENNMGKFEETVDVIDNSGGLVEAINYLEQNFRWQKNEVSLKFIDLVKRRFDN